ITVDSTPGDGTTFKIYLPTIDALATSARLPAARAQGGRETVLLVEDEDQVRAVACAILRRQGYNVLDARHADDALLLCNRHAGAIHLILTDVVMPRISGPELARRLAAVRPNMKILFMSGYTDDTVFRHGVAATELAFVQKPFTPEVLLSKVREALGPAPVTKSV
ncbi:MAG TPA: response regulator, partial [Polyangia bacterium]